ncbi:MAG: hypothetical protein ACQEXJ_05290 [Myxococcota bacterium]
MALDDTERRRKARQLAAGFQGAVDRSGARFVLVTSVAREDGLEQVMELVEPELRSPEGRRFHIISWEGLRLYDPQTMSKADVVLVPAPPLLEGEEILWLPRDWMDAFDGTILVVKKRVTRKRDLREAVTWLRAAGAPPIGFVWNEEDLPVRAAEGAATWRRATRLFAAPPGEGVASEDGGAATAEET